MKFVKILPLILGILIMAGIAFAQQLTSEPSFQLVQQIGKTRPRGMVYEPNFDRFAWINSSGRLVLVDASTLETQHILYESGAYNEYRFSNDGRWLALSIDRRIELWNTQTGTLQEDIEPDGALQSQGPLIFAEDDGLFAF